MNLTNRPVYQKRTTSPKKRNRAETEHWASEYGSDDEYLAFVRTLPSAYDGRYDYVDGMAKCQAAHYRNADNSGISTKPPFSAIPLTAAQHMLQHAVGQYNFMERERWEYLIEWHLRRWIASKGYTLPPTPEPRYKLA